MIMDKHEELLKEMAKLLDGKDFIDCIRLISHLEAIILKMQNVTSIEFRDIKQQQIEAYEKFIVGSSICEASLEFQQVEPALLSLDSSISQPT